MPRSSEEVIPYWDQDFSFEAPTFPNMVDSVAMQRLLPLVFSFAKGRQAMNASEFRQDDPLLRSGLIL